MAHQATPPFTTALLVALQRQHEPAPHPVQCPTCKTPASACRDLRATFGQRCCGYCTTRPTADPSTH